MPQECILIQNGGIEQRMSSEQLKDSLLKDVDADNLSEADAQAWLEFKRDRHARDGWVVTPNLGGFAAQKVYESLRVKARQFITRTRVV